MSNTSAKSPHSTDSIEASAWEQAELQQLRRFRALPLRDKILAVESQARVSKMLLSKAAERRAAVKSVKANDAGNAEE